ncbi:uncharacterized protein TNCV_3995001 [Trichonephila clavipes]|nr:uncharacterized protein TNCV_3995001 [Trichonephila clavipes]
MMSSKFQLLIVCMMFFCLLANAKPQYRGSQYGGSQYGSSQYGSSQYGSSQTVSRTHSSSYTPTGQRETTVQQTVSNSSPYGQTQQTSVTKQASSFGGSNIARAKKVARFNETFSQTELRRLEQAEREAAHRAAETPEQSQALIQYKTETIEVAESRQRAVAERAQQRCLIFTRNTWGVFDKAAFEYGETLDYESHKLIKIEAMNKEYRFCGTLKWKEEYMQACVVGGSSSFN